MPRLVTAPVLPIPVIPELVISDERITLRLYEELDAEGRGRHTQQRTDASDARPPVGCPEGGEPPYPRRHYPRASFDGTLLSSAFAGRALVPLWGGVFDIASLRQRHDWTDMGLWAFLYAYRTRRYFGPSNLTPLTLTKRQDLLRYADDNGVLFLGTIFVPTVSSAFDELRVRVNHHPDYPPVGAPAAPADMTSSLDDSAPHLAISGPDTIRAGETATFTIDAGGDTMRSELHLEATAGYLAIRRLRPADNSTFILRALDLAPGSEIRLKAGFRVWPGLAEKTVRVV
jgi:hypothetical protein